MSCANVLVTGGARGIGAGIVEALAAAGSNVAFCGRSCEADVRPFLDHLTAEYQGKFAYYRCDVSSEKDRTELLNNMQKDFGCLDVLVNNAGVAPSVRADMLDMSEESFDRVMDINLKGPFFLTQAAAKLILANNNGRFHCIINTGSVSAVYASINRGEYCISKAGIAMATKLWAARLAEEGICVYEIRPGVIHSDMTSTVSAKYDKMIAEGLTLQKRWGEPSDIGKAVAMLLRGDLAYSTGTVIDIGGGMEIARL